MSMSNIMGTALSGLLASQAGLRTSSNNISNINTPGYAREEANITSQALGGMGAGVRVEGVRRITDAFLTAASLNAASRASASETRLELLDRTQASFGDPSSGTSVFSSMNQLFASLSEVASDPSSPVRRAASVSDLKATLNEFNRLSADIQAIRAEADARIAHVADRINDLLQEVGKLNSELTHFTAAGDSTGAENTLSNVLDELSQLMDIRVVRQTNGSVEVRTQDGLLLSGNSVATVTYNSLGTATPGNVYGSVTVQFGSAPPQKLEDHVSGGELRGLLDIRDQELPEIAHMLGEFAGRTADALNRAHNQATPFPPVSTFTGRDSGMLATDLHGFSGTTTLTVIDGDGRLQHTIELDFDAGTIDVDGGGAVALSGGTVGDVVADLNGALGGIGGSASFVNGVMTLNAAAGEGLAFVEDPTTPTDRGGRTFSHYFGLNDLVTSSSPLFFETGFQTTDAHGFTAGDTFSLRLQSVSGKPIREATITIPGAPNNTFGDIITALNDPTNGLGAYGSFALDTDGELQFTPAAGYEGADIKVLSDNTRRGTTSRTFTGLMGVGDGPRAIRAQGLRVRSDIDADVTRLALGKIDLSGAPALGDIVTGTGDGDGGNLLRLAGSTPIDFDAAGGFPGMTSTLIDYAGRVAADAGRRANSAERENDAAIALKTTADERRGSVEGVNLDEELVKLTNFQQSFNAASRLIQAVKEMNDILINMV